MEPSRKPVCFFFLAISVLIGLSAGARPAAGEGEALAVEQALAVNDSRMEEAVAMNGSMGDAIVLGPNKFSLSDRLTKLCKDKLKAAGSTCEMDYESVFAGATELAASAISEVGTNSQLLTDNAWGFTYLLSGAIMSGIDLSRQLGMKSKDRDFGCWFAKLLDNIVVALTTNKVFQAELCSSQTPSTVAGCSKQETTQTDSTDLALCFGAVLTAAMNFAGGLSGVDLSPFFAFVLDFIRVLKEGDATGKPIAEAFTSAQMWDLCYGLVKLAAFFVLALNGPMVVGGVVVGAGYVAMASLDLFKPFFEDLARNAHQAVSGDQQDLPKWVDRTNEKKLSRLGDKCVAHVSDAIFFHLRAVNAKKPPSLEEYFVQQHFKMFFSTKAQTKKDLTDWDEFLLEPHFVEIEGQLMFLNNAAVIYNRYRRFYEMGISTADQGHCLKGNDKNLADEKLGQAQTWACVVASKVCRNEEPLDVAPCSKRSQVSQTFNWMASKLPQTRLSGDDLDALVRKAWHLTGNEQEKCIGAPDCLKSNKCPCDWPFQCV